MADVHISANSPNRYFVLFVVVRSSCHSHCNSVLGLVYSIQTCDSEAGMVGSNNCQAEVDKLPSSCLHIVVTRYEGSRCRGTLLAAADTYDAIAARGIGGDTSW